MFTGVLHCCIFRLYRNPLSDLDQVEDPLSFLGSSHGKYVQDSEPDKYISWYETASIQPTPTDWCNITSPIECNLQSLFAALLLDQNVFGIVSPFGSLTRLHLKKLEANTSPDRPAFADLRGFASADRFRGVSGRLVSVVADEGKTLVTAASQANNSLEPTQSGISDSHWVSVTVSISDIEATITEDMNLQISRYPTEVLDLANQLSDLCGVLWPYVKA